MSFYLTKSLSDELEAFVLSRRELINQKGEVILPSYENKKREIFLGLFISSLDYHELEQKPFVVKTNEKGSLWIGAAELPIEIDGKITKKPLALNTSWKNEEVIVIPKLIVQEGHVNRVRVVITPVKQADPQVVDKKIYELEPQDKKYITLTEIKFKKKLTVEEVKKLTKDLQIEELVNSLKFHPTDLKMMLFLLHPEQFTSENIKDIIEGFALLELRGSHGSGSNKRSGADKFINVLVNFIKKGLLKNVSEKEKFIIKEITKRQLYFDIKDFNVEKVLQFLQSKLSEVKDPFVREILQMIYVDFATLQNLTFDEFSKTPFLHQIEDGRFLMNHHRAIVADEPGLGKTLSALIPVEKLGLKQVIIFSKAEMKNTIKEEILFHFKEKPHILEISGPKKMRQKLLNEIDDKKFIILNYELLEFISDAELIKLVSKADAVILDEAHEIENKAGVRNRRVRLAIANLKDDAYLWGLTATPFRNRPEKLFGVLNLFMPEKFNDFNIFKKIYCEDTEGMKLLHFELSGFMIRHKKIDVLSEYDLEQPLEGQGRRLPKKVFIDYEKEGKYELSARQTQLMEWIFDEKQRHKFVNYLNELNPHRSRTLEDLNPFTLLGYLFQIQIGAPHLGLGGQSQIFDEMEKIVAKRTAQGKKVLLFANNISVIDEALKRLKKMNVGAVRFDGSVKGFILNEQGRPVLYRINSDGNYEIDEQQGEPLRERSYHRHLFQNDPQTQALVATGATGGVGVTFTAADAVLLLQKPYNFTDLLQWIDRAHRIPRDEKHLKAALEIISMVATYPKGLMRGDKKRFFEMGTPSQLLEELIEGKEYLFHLVIDGEIRENMVEYEVSNLLSKIIPNTEKSRKKYHKKGVEVVEFLFPWYQSANEEQKTVLAKLSHEWIYGSTQDLKAALNPMIEDSHFDLEDIKYILALFEVKNKTLRDHLLGRLPIIYKRLLENHLSNISHSAAEFLSIPQRMTLVLFSLMAGDKKILKFIDQLYHHAKNIPDPVKRLELIEKLNLALMELSDYSSPDRLISFFKLIFKHEPNPLAAIEAIEYLALTKNLNFPYFEKILAKTISLSDLTVSLKQNYLHLVKKLFSLKKVNESKVKEIYQQWGHFSQILLLEKKYRSDPEYAMQHSYLLEAVEAIFQDHFDELRRGEVKSKVGNEVQYLKENEFFWNTWNESHETRTDRVGLKSSDYLTTLTADYQKLTALALDQISIIFQSRKDQKLFRLFLDASIEKKEQDYQAIQKFHKQLGHLFYKLTVLKEPLNNDEKEILAKFDKNLKENKFVEIFKLVQKPQRDLMLWMELDYLMSSLRIKGKSERENKTVIDKLYQVVSQLVGVYKKSDADTEYETLKVLRTIQHQLRSMQRHDHKFNDLRIVDTADPKVLLEYGYLAPDMQNCLSYNAHVKDNNNLMEILGNKTKRVILVFGRVEDGEEELLSASVATIRKDDHENPVIFLERGLKRKGYMFEEYMLEHLISTKAKPMAKNAKMNIKVSRQVVATKNSNMKNMVYPYQRVHHAGFFMNREYIEALYHERKAQKVSHISEVMFDSQKEGQK